MKTFLLSLLAASLAVAFVEQIPRSATKKQLQLLCGLFLLVLLLSPISALVSFFRDADFRDILFSETEADYQEEFQSILDEESLSYFSSCLEEKTEKAFSISGDDLTIRLDYDGEQIRTIYLLLSGKAVLKDSAAIENYVENLVGIHTESVIR